MKSNFKGTTGKWIFDKKDVSSEKAQDLGDIVCEAPIQHKQSYVRWQYNALLISKAPEMLEMLENILLETDPHGESKRWNEINNLIKEATEL